MNKPPQAIDIEIAVLGAMLLERTAIAKAVEVIDETAFYKPAHQSIYRAIVSLFTKGEPADLLTVTEELRRNGELEKSGGEFYLTEITTKVSTASSVEYHAHIVLERSLLRRLIELSQDTLSRAYDETEDVLQLLSDVTMRLTEIRMNSVKERSIPGVQIARETNEEIDKIHSGQDESLKSGFVDIDAITGGYRKGNLIITAALKKRGKSTLALQTMFYNAKKGIPSLFFSLEMTRVDLMLREALIEEKISWLKLVSKKLTALEIERLKRRVTTLGKLPIFVLDRPINIMDVTAESDRMITDKGIKLIIADYTQKIVPVTRRTNENREQEVANISSGLKNIAFKHKIALIALSQVNKDLETRESRALEQDADKIITINAPDKDEPTADGNGIIIGVRIEQRFGAGGNFGDCKMIYDKVYGYWKSYSGQDELQEPAKAETDDIF